MKYLIRINRLNKIYCNTLAAILSSDTALRHYLSPEQDIRKITGVEYYRGCLNWETKKSGHCFCILLDDRPIGSISYTRKSDSTAAFGVWLSSEYWNHGYGTELFTQFKKAVKADGYKFLTGSIQKSNLRSKRMCEKCGAIFEEDENRWYPYFAL